MKLNYRNWVPAWMKRAAIAATVTLLALLVFLFAARPLPSADANAATDVILLVALVACGYFAYWCVATTRAFDWDAEDSLSKRIVEGTASHVTVPEGGTCLDVGCGSGALTIAVAKRNPKAKIIGVDRWGKEYSSFSKGLCEDNACAEGVTNASFTQGDARKLDFPDETFDAVTSNYVYHNVSGADKQELLLETLRTLKKGGTFAIHDLMTRRHYGDMEAFAQRLRDEGYADVRLIPTADGTFMSPTEERRYRLTGSTLLVGRK